jgi:hypothetical protein
MADDYHGDGYEGYTPENPFDQRSSTVEESQEYSDDGGVNG